MSLVFLPLTGGNWIYDGQNTPGNTMLSWNLYIFVHLLLPVTTWALHQVERSVWGVPHFCGALVSRNTFLKRSREGWTVGRNDVERERFSTFVSLKLGRGGERGGGWLWQIKGPNKQLITLITEHEIKRGREKKTVWVYKVVLVIPLTRNMSNMANNREAAVNSMRSDQIHLC